MDFRGSQRPSYGVVSGIAGNLRGYLKVVGVFQGGSRSFKQFQTVAGVCGALQVISMVFLDVQNRCVQRVPGGLRGGTWRNQECVNGFNGTPSDPRGISGGLRGVAGDPGISIALQWVLVAFQEVSGVFQGAPRAFKGVLRCIRVRQDASGGFSRGSWRSRGNLWYPWFKRFSGGFRGIPRVTL